MLVPSHIFQNTATGTRNKSTKFRFFGLFAAYTLMAMFTAYIYIILNFSAFVPCSCGGVLENMTWNQHLVFNICFIILAGIAILLMPNNLQINHKTLNYE